MAGILTKGIEFYYGTGTGSSITYTKVPNLMQIPNFGGTSEQVDVTTFENAARVYISGIKDYGGALPFEFLFEPGASGNYATLKALEDGAAHAFKVVFPDAITSTGSGTTFTFTGFPLLEIESAAVNDALKFNCNITINSDIETTDAT